MLKLPPLYPQWLYMVKAGRISGGKLMGNVTNFLFDQLKDMLLDSFSGIIPVALTVAGAVLVVFLGWRLFKNFTRG